MREGVSCTSRYVYATKPNVELKIARNTIALIPAADQTQRVASPLARPQRLSSTPPSNRQQAVNTSGGHSVFGSRSTSVASAQHKVAPSTVSCQPTCALAPKPRADSSTATPANPTASPTQVRVLTGLARRPYMPSHASQNAELELMSAAWLEAMCRSASTERPLLSTTPSTAEAATETQSRGRLGSERPRERATKVSSEPASTKRTPAASSGGSVRAMMRFTA